MSKCLLILWDIFRPLIFIVFLAIDNDIEFFKNSNCGCYINILQTMFGCSCCKYCYEINTAKVHTCFGACEHMFITYIGRTSCHYVIRKVETKVVCQSQVAITSKKYKKFHKCTYRMLRFLLSSKGLAKYKLRKQQE